MRAGENAILTAAKLYHEDWTINNLDLSPTLTEALTEIEATIQAIGGIASVVRSRRCSKWILP